MTLLSEVAFRWKFHDSTFGFAVVFVAFLIFYFLIFIVSIIDVVWKNSRFSFLLHVYI